MRWKFLRNVCGDQQILWDPSGPGYKTRNKRRDALSANCRSVWSARSDGPALFVLRSEVTEDNFAKCAFAKSAKLD